MPYIVSQDLWVGQKFADILSFGIGKNFEVIDIPQMSKPVPKEQCILVGRNKLSEKFVSQAEWNTLGTDGYIIRSIPQHNLLICAGNSVRGIFYAAHDLAENETFNDNRVEIPSFKWREKVVYMACSDDFGQARSKVVRDVFSCHEDIELQKKRSDRFIHGLLKMRVNTVVFTTFGMDYLDFDELGYPEFYNDGCSKLKQNHLLYLQQMQQFIARCRQFGLRIAIFHCGVVGFDGGEQLKNNFFDHHPELESQIGRDDPSINWHGGRQFWGEKNKIRSFCPSKEGSWNFIESYYRKFFELFDIDEYWFLIGDCGGGLNCGCDECKEFPYEDRIAKFNKIIAGIRNKHKPDCTIVHRNDDFINYYPGREVEVEKKVLGNIKNITTGAKWAQPMCFDFNGNWKDIEKHPLIGKIPDLRLVFWYGWNNPTYDMFPGQYPGIYAKQLQFAAQNDVSGIFFFHEGDWDSSWQPHDVFYPEKDDNIYPWHFDVAAFIKALWNPTNFDYQAFQLKWLKKYFGPASESVQKAFLNGEQILEIMSRWDLGDYCDGGVPPFSYMDMIWSKQDMRRVASEFYIRTETIETQFAYPKQISFFDATCHVQKMIDLLDQAKDINPQNKILSRWFNFAQGLMCLALAYKKYHEAYFVSRTSNSNVKQILLEVLEELKKSRILKGYGQTSCDSPTMFTDWFMQEVNDQLAFIEAGNEPPYSPGRHWKAGACLEGEIRECYIYD